MWQIDKGKGQVRQVSLFFVLFSHFSHNLFKKKKSYSIESEPLEFHLFFGESPSSF